jgi:hypothetical protein
MSLGDLLTIDAAAELRKLAEATLEGPWQAPAELVRRAILAGARLVEVELQPARICVHDDGAPLGVGRERALHVLLDEGQPAAERHEALVALEAEPELLALAALRPRTVTIERAGGRTTIAIEGAKLDRRAAARWLRAGCRFAHATVVVDDAPIDAGFRAAFAEVPLTDPLVGRLALTGDETAHLWLLAGGVVSSHLTLPDTPAFEAALDLSSLVSSRTPAALREAVQAHLGALVDEAVRLMLRAAEMSGESETRDRFLRDQLLVAARRGYRRDEIFRRPLFPACFGPDGVRETRLSLTDLGGSRAVACLERGEDPGSALLPEGPVLVVDADERGRLAQLLGVRFHPVEKRRLKVGWRSRLRRLALHLTGSVAAALSRLRHGRGRVLSDAALSTDERAFVRALRAACVAGSVPIFMTEGGGPVRRARDGFRLPRHNRDVAAAVQAVARDRAWAYVALVALLDAADAVPAALVAWRRGG